MSEIKTHKDLDVWKEAMSLAKWIYKLTADFPKEEIYGLVSQIRRAVRKMLLGLIKYLRGKTDS